MASLNRQQSYKDQLKKNILDTAIAIISNHGEPGLTIRLLAETIEYSPRTIYLYYKNKDTLLDGIVQDMFSRTLNVLQDADLETQSPEDIVTNQIQRHIRNGLAHPNLYRAVLNRISVPDYETVPAHAQVSEITADFFSRCLPSDLRDRHREVTEAFFASVRGFTMMLINAGFTDGDEEAEERIGLFIQVTLKGIL